MASGGLRDARWSWAHGSGPTVVPSNTPGRAWVSVSSPPSRLHVSGSFTMIWVWDPCASPTGLFPPDLSARHLPSPSPLQGCHAPSPQPSCMCPSQAVPYVNQESSHPLNQTPFSTAFSPVLGVTCSLPHQSVDGSSAAPLLRSSIGQSDTCGCCCLCCGGLCTLRGHEPSAPVFLSLPASLPLPEGKVEWGGLRVAAGSCAPFPEGTSDGGRFLGPWS